METQQVVEFRQWQKDASVIALDYKILLAEVCTGAGKTFFAIHLLKQILKENPNYRVLIVVPKLVIMSGWLQELYDEFPLTEIGCFYGEMKECSRITLTTMSSIRNIALDMFKVIIADEVHHMKPPSLLKLLNRPDWEYKFGLSATVNDKDFGHLKLEKAFNYSKFTYDLADGLKDGVLNKFEWYDRAIELDDKTFYKSENIQIDINQMLAALGGFDRYKHLKSDDPRKSRLNKLFNERNKLIFNYERKFDELINIINKHPNRKIIIFNEYNTVGDKMVDLIKFAKHKCVIVNSELTPKEKESRIREYNENKVNILITSKMFDEGYNLPAIDLVIIFSGNSTERQTKQRVGRGLRLKSYNTLIYQIYCKSTFEEKYAKGRLKYFKPLTEKYEVKVC